MTAAERADEAKAYDPRDFQEKWQARWGGRPNRSVPAMTPVTRGSGSTWSTCFPYPSGDLHMGHAEAYAIGDAMARVTGFLRGEGRNVLAPDRVGTAFGLPAENAAIRNGTHPADWTLQEHRDPGGVVPPVRDPPSTGRGGLATCDPEYYRWKPVAVPAVSTSAGLAYRKGRLRQLVPPRTRNRAGQRGRVVNGRCERWRHRGRPPGADPVVLQDHRIWRTGLAGGTPADLEGNWPDPRADHAAELDRAAPTGAEVDLRRRRAGPRPVTVLHDAAGHAVRRGRSWWVGRGLPRWRPELLCRGSGGPSSRPTWRRWAS